MRRGILVKRDQAVSTRALNYGGHKWWKFGLYNWKSEIEWGLVPSLGSIWVFPCFHAEILLPATSLATSIIQTSKGTTSIPSCYHPGHRPVRLAYQQPTSVLFSRNMPTTNNQPVVLSLRTNHPPTISQQKAPLTSDKWLINQKNWTSSATLILRHPPRLFFLFWYFAMPIAGLPSNPT
jgi:hypothetical protein